jgi:large subunit ribosomal protein L21
MYAVIETGGKQYRVQNGDQICVEKLNVEDGAQVVFDKVLVCGEGADIKVGTPYLEGITVEGEAVESGKGKKVVIFKYKAKKDYRKKQGHRQPYTMVEITGLGVDSKAKKAEEVKAEAPAEAKEIKVSASMKKDELIAVAKANNIEVDEKATKAVIIETIEAALK